MARICKIGGIGLAAYLSTTYGLLQMGVEPVFCLMAGVVAGWAWVEYSL